MPLENDPENACVGCGPANPLGLRLTFERTPGGAKSRFVAEARWQGFPGRLHSAVLYLSLLETMNWSLHASTGRMGLPSRTGALVTGGIVVVGSTVALEGRLVSMNESARTASVEAWATIEPGGEVARLQREYALVDEPTFLRRMGYDSLPHGYEGDFT